MFGFYLSCFTYFGLSVAMGHGIGTASLMTRPWLGWVVYSMVMLFSCVLGWMAYMRWPETFLEMPKELVFAITFGAAYVTAYGFDRIYSRTLGRPGLPSNQL